MFISLLKKGAAYYVLGLNFTVLFSPKIYMLMTCFFIKMHIFMMYSFFLWICAHLYGFNGYCKYQHREHEVFKRKGADLFCVITLKLSEALCGFSRVIDHMDGRKLRLDSPKGKVVRPESMKVSCQYRLIACLHLARYYTALSTHF